MATILIIDDELQIRKMLTRLLKRNGHEILEAENGSQGLRLYLLHRPDLILTDLVMPEKEGIELIRELKEADPKVKIIALSGGGRIPPEIYLNLALKLGATQVFSKPVENQILLSAVEEILCS